MSVKNSTIIEKVWLEGSNDFQQRIPNPSVNGYAAAISELFQPYNNDLFNQFTGMLNGLMGTFVNSRLFENPLRELKKDALTWGNSVREVAVKYLRAHSYRVDSETLLKLEKPEYVEWFYSVQNPRRYEFSWSKYELQRVFSQGDSYAFDDLLSATLTQMYSSDNYDEMNIMIQCFAEADQRMGGLFRHQLSAFPTDEATGKELLTVIRAYAGKMQFPTMNFNHIDVPVHENGDTLVLWVTPETRANLDVQALSAVFQLDKAEVQYRIITIPEFPLPNICAALTSEDFIYARDVWYGVEAPFYNAENLTYKYYLHHAEIIGVNPCANCVLFGTDADTAIDTVTVTPTTLAFTPNTGSVAPGGEIQLHLDLTGTVANDASDLIGVEPDAALFTVAADRSGTAVPLNSRTYVDDMAVLHVQKTGLETGDTITVTAEMAYVNPSGVQPVVSPATFTATIL